MGIVPTKVTAEHGAVVIDDMLVASVQLSNAIKGTDQDHVQDATVGKAFQPLACGAALIKVLVGAQ